MEEFKLLKDYQGNNIGSGFVAYENDAIASKVFSELNNTIQLGRFLHISFAKENPKNNELS